MYKQWAPCERNPSYNFIPIFLKLCTCFLHGLKICMWFGYNPCFNFCYFFHFANFVISWPQILWKCIDFGYLVSATPHTVLYHLFETLHMFLPWLEMSMWFGYNPWINFCHFFHFVNFCHFLTSDSMKVCRQWVLCKRNALYNFMPIFIQLCTSVCPWFEDVHVVWI